MDAYRRRSALLVTGLSLLVAGIVVPRLAAQGVDGGRGGPATDSTGHAAGTRDSLADTAAGRRAPVPSFGLIARFTGARLSALPIDDSRQALGLAPGVAMRGTTLGIAGVPDVTIEGSGADHTAVLVDGAPARFETLGYPLLALGADAVSELSVATGVAPASVPEARGAVIGYLTPAGGARFAAGLSAGTDGLFSLSSTVGFNRFDGYAGGPVPGVRNLTWYVSGALYGQSSPYRGAGADTMPTFALAGIDTVVSYTDYSGNAHTTAIPRFAQVSGSCGSLGGDSSATARVIQSNYGLRCQGLRLDLAWTTSRRAQGKLLYTYGRGSSLSITGLADDFQQRQWPGQDLADNLLFTGTRTHSALAVLNWSQRLPALAGGAFTLTGNLSVGADGYQSGPLDLTTEGATRDPALGIEFSMLRFAGLSGLAFPLADAVIQQLRSGTFQAPYAGRNDLAAFQAFRFNPYGVSGGFPTNGLGGAEVTMTSETRVNGRLGAEWRVRPWLKVEAGADFSRTNLSFYDATLTSTLEPDAFTAQPRRAGVFALGRLAGGGLTLEAGLRGDQYVTGSDFPVVPGRIYSNPAWDTGDTSYAARASRVLAPGRTQRFLTPHVRMGFRVDTNTVAWAGFGQQVEVPPFALLFANVNSDLASTSTAAPFGRDVSYVTSTTVEGGIGHAFSSGVSLAASVYEKTNTTPYTFAGVSVYDPFIGGDPSVPNEALTLLTTTSGSRALGGDVRLAWERGGVLSGSASYSIWQSHLEPSQQSFPVALSYPDVTTQAVAGTLVARVPDEWGHGSGLGAAARGLGAALTARFTSGEPYTPLLNAGTGAIAPLSGVLPQMSPYPLQNTPWTWNLDLRLTKVIATGRTRWTIYAEAHNLLDARNLVALFAETGTDQNALFKNNLIAPQIAFLQADAGALWVTKQVTVNGTTQTLTGVDLSDCSQYPATATGGKGVADCLALRQVEARWGNGDGFYDANEINRALTAWYDINYGTGRFYGPARTARVGLAIAF